MLAKLLREIKAGDVLARSVSHRLQVIEQLEEKGAHFRSLNDPIDTPTPQGMFSLQVLGAVAQLERTLISERTKAGIKAAKARGKLPGNPGFRELRPDALAKASRARERSHLADLTTTMSSWLPIVQRMRPDHPWEDVARSLNRETGRNGRLIAFAVRSNGWCARDWLIAALIVPSPRRTPQDRLMSLITGIANANPI